MNSLLALVIGASTFWVIFLTLYKRYDLRKYGITLESGAAVFRTKRGLKKIDAFAKKHPKLLIHYGNISVVLALALCIFVSFNLLFNLYNILTSPRGALPGASFVLPGLIPGLTVYWWLISIGSLMLVHEISHGLLMRVHRIPTKSMGGLLFAVIPGAFVEPDEKKLRSAPTRDRLRVYAVGSVTNIIFSFLCLLLLLSIVVPKEGVYVWGVRENGPCDNKLAPGMKILRINNVVINSWKDLKLLENIKPGQTVTIETDQGTFEVIADNYYSENRGSLGLIPIWAIPESRFLNPLFAAYITVLELRGQRVFNQIVYSSLIPWWLVDMLKWMFVLNLGVGLFNLLPMLPLDGGYMIETILEKRMPKKRARKACIVLSLVMLGVLICNLVPYFFS